MKNILLDKLPNYTKSGLKIRSDFREMIKFELLMQDKRLKDKDKIFLALQLFYYNLDDIKDVKNAVDELLWFYKCGKEDYKQNTDYSDNNQIKTKQIFSFEFDDDYIYSAFLTQYKIDLNSIKYLHWWKFKALFNSLDENNQFVKIMGYRSIDLTKIKDKETKNYYKKMKKIYKLPDMRTDEEKENDFANCFL